jgi:hypothetical protein
MSPYRLLTHRYVRRVLTSGVLLAGGCSAGASDARSRPDTSTVASAPWDGARVDTLLRFGREDQAGRDGLAQAAVAQDTATLFASMRADSARTRWLRAAVVRHGWPSRASAGASAQQAAWLILQHSPDTAWQAAMLPDLERLASGGEIPRDDVALLTDRILVHRGQPQRYGSQFDLVDGRLVPSPVEDLAGLDARRASVGMPPMAEYVRVLAEQMRVPAVWPPRR